MQKKSVYQAAYFVERKTREILLLFCCTANRQTAYSVFHRILAVFIRQLIS